MQLPDYLKLSINQLISHIRDDELLNFSSQLSNRYRENEISTFPFMRDKGDYLAYLTTRFPATFGAVYRVLQEIPETISIKSILDVGAGPGTAFFAANEVFAIEKASLIEKEQGLIAIGKTLTDARCEWFERDLKLPQVFEAHDLVTLSYALNELPEETWKMLLESLWAATNAILVIVEPGTPQGFKRILAVRDILQSLGGNILAPCFHQAKCPMQENMGWCHFSQRIARSKEHRKSKNAELNFEDEKFSYIIFSKSELTLQNKGARVLFPPKKYSGHLSLVLCGEEGIAQQVISRKQKSLYKKARKAAWGDLI